MYSVILSNRASKDLTGIIEYMAEANPDAAERTGCELVNLAMSLDSLPYRGSKVKKRRGVLKLVHGNYLIYYRVNEDKKAVEILNFKHGARVSEGSRRVSTDAGRAGDSGGVQATTDLNGGNRSDSLIIGLAPGNSLTND